MLIPMMLFTCLMFLVYKYIILKCTTPANRPPGPRWIPLVGSALYFKRHYIRQYFFELALFHGKLFQVQLLDTNMVVLNTIEMVNKAFCSHGKTFNHRPSLFVGSRLGLLNSVSFLDENAKYRVHKKVFMKNMALYGSRCSTFETKFLDELENVARKIGHNAEKGFEVVELLQRSTVNVISILLTGTQATDKHIQQTLDLVSGEDFFLNAFTNTLLSNVPYLVNLPYYNKRLEKITEAKKLLQENLFNALKKTEIDNADPGFVQGLIRDQKMKLEGSYTLSDDSAKAIIITDILSVGFLTTASVLPCVILCLVNNLECQTKLHEELDKVIGHNRQPSVDDSKTCHFTEAIIKETMRYITPYPFWLPHSCKRNVEFEGYHITANSQIVANTWYIHHDERIWGDPWCFRPERFLDANDRILPNDHIYMKSLIPFGVGRRRCPGMEFTSTRMFLYVASIFQKYSLIPVPEKCRSCDPRSEGFMFDLLLKPKPFYCRARRRS